MKQGILPDWFDFITVFSASMPFLLLLFAPFSPKKYRLAAKISWFPFLALLLALSNDHYYYTPTKMTILETTKIPSTISFINLSINLAFQKLY